MSVNAPNNKLKWKAPLFKLKNIDGNYHSLDDLKGKNGTVIAFICNHCPYVISIAERLKFEADELYKHKINTLAIMSNDKKQYTEDSYENMIYFSEKYKFNFPYLHDESQQIAKNYGAVCTPDIYGFDSNLILQYRGRIDSGVMNSNSKNINRDLYKAMIEIMTNGAVSEEQYNSFGCSIKWKENE